MPKTKTPDKRPGNSADAGAEGSKGSGRLRKILAILGPGVITGAADDDPSGISTYSVAGAAYGYATLWIALLTFPLMAAVQLMCARLGMVTGQGLAAAVRDNYPRWVLWGSVLDTDRGKRHQHWSRSRRHGGSDSTRHGDPATCLDSILCLADSRAADLDFLQAHCTDFQVDDAGALRVCASV